MGCETVGWFHVSSEQGPMAGFCEGGDEPSGYLWPEGEILDQLCDSHSLKNDSGMELGDNIGYLAEVEIANLKHFHFNDRYRKLMDEAILHSLGGGNRPQ